MIRRNIKLERSMIHPFLNLVIRQVTSTPPSDSPFTEGLSSQAVIMVTPPPINTEAKPITTSLLNTTPSSPCKSDLNQEFEKEYDGDYPKPKWKPRMRRIKIRPYSIRRSMPTKTRPNYVYTMLSWKLDEDEDAMDKKLQTRWKDHQEKGRIVMMMKGLQLDQTRVVYKEKKIRFCRFLALTSTGWQITDTRDAGADSSMHRSDPESEHSEQSSDDISKQDEGNDSDMEDTDNAHIPKVSTTTWFKPIPESERPATPEPEWTIPPNDFPEPEHNWANAYATTFKVPEENKLQRKTYDIGSFIKWFCRRTGKKKLCKADLEGPAFNLVKAFHKNSVFLQYQMDECHKLLTNKVDLSNPEGHQILRNMYEPLPLGGPPGQILALRLVPSLWVKSDAIMTSVLSMASLLVGVRREGNSISTTSESSVVKLKAHHLPRKDKTSLHTAVNMWIRNLVIRNRVGDLQLGIESYQTKINLERPNWDAADYYFKEDYTIVPKPRAVVYRDRNDQRKLMRLNELHKYSDGTLTRVMEKLDQMVKDFHLFEYNKGMGGLGSGQRMTREEAKTSSQQSRKDYRSEGSIEV
ncbi:hypothetical protein Tco_1501813 [Tanacetum coccineum]